jgi:23S rRNA maturation mini-RNase III
MTQWKYKIAQLKIENVYDVSAEEQIVQIEAFMNELGEQGWEIMEVKQAMLGEAYYHTFTCKCERSR